MHRLPSTTDSQVFAPKPCTHQESKEHQKGEWASEQQHIRTRFLQFYSALAWTIQKDNKEVRTEELTCILLYPGLL